MRIEVKGATVEFLNRPFVTPLQLSTGPITEITEARAAVTVTLSGREVVGRGAIYLSDLWAWPDLTLSHEARDLALRNLCGVIAGNLAHWLGGQPAHPLELGLRLHHAVCGEETFGVPSLLARAMCASPFDAALHDAAGKAVGMSAFRLYDDEPEIPEADALFPEQGAARAIKRMLRHPEAYESDAWLIVNKNDDLDRVVRPWVVERGYRCFKLKIMGRDIDVDARRTVEVYRGLRAMGVDRPRLTVDSNEANPDAASVLEYLECLRDLDEGAFAALEYLEQPTGRDIRQARHDWREIGRLKPVMLDEGLTSLDLLEEAALQGWSGLALKTCKGHSFALVAAAWAHERGMLLSLQDLTNPGLSAIHAMLFAAHVPTINGVELNSPQFTPAANGEWLPRLAELFEPRHGVHKFAGPMPVGLGSSL